MAQIALDRGVSSIAVTYENSDYGKGLSEHFTKAFIAGGGTVTTNSPHENGKGDTCNFQPYSWDFYLSGPITLFDLDLFENNTTIIKYFNFFFKPIKWIG